MRKRFLSMLLAIVMVVGLVPGFAVTASAAEITPSQPTNGDGSADNPYQITSVEELYWFAESVNGGDADACAELTANITVNTDVLTADGSLSANAADFTVWTPIGNAFAIKYTGQFDGKGHTVSGLYTVVDPEEKFYVGLFGHAGDGAVIKNVTVEDSYFSGRSGIGGVIGYTTVDTEVSVENCHNGATVVAHTSGNDGYAGGIIGTVNGEAAIKNCTNYGKISVKTDYFEQWQETSAAGGIVGRAETATFENCHNSGDITGIGRLGGLVGEVYFKYAITLCSNTGNITGTDFEGTQPSGAAKTFRAQNIGGLVGVVTQPQSGLKVDITDCFNAGEISGYTYIGGLVGSPKGSVGNYTNVHSYGKVTASLMGLVFQGGAFVQTMQDCYLFSSSGQIYNSYYLDTLDGTPAGEARTATEFANGVVVDSLNAGRSGADAVWMQGELYPVLKPVHTHDWTYTANGATTITATCGNTDDGCDNPDGGSIIITASNSTYTTDTPNAASLTDADGDPAVVIGGLTELPTIQYQKKNGDGWDAETSTAPTNAGTYRASITVDDQTAYVEYTIAKADQDAPAAPTGTSNGTTISVHTQEDCEYSIDGDNWQTESSFENLTSATEYTVYARLPGDENHNPSPASSAIVKTEITEVNITFTPPVKNAVPEMPVVEPGAKYVVSNITWDPAVNGKFLGKTEYTAIIRLSPTDGYKFYEPISDVKVNNEEQLDAIHFGKDIFVWFKFDPTQAREISAFTGVVTAPAAEHTYGDVFNPDGLVVEVLYDDGTTGALAYSNSNSGWFEFDSEIVLSEVIGVKYKYDTEGNFTPITLTAVNPKPITITADRQDIDYGDTVDSSADKVTVDTLVPGDTLSSITLTASTDDVTTDGEIIPSGAVILNANGENVTENYDITYENGLLVIERKSDFDYNLWHHSLMMLFNQEYRITASSTNGGTITPAGVAKVKYDKNITYTITPDEGYEIVSVLADGKDVGAVSEYTFKRVKENHTITAVFEEIKWQNPFTDVDENDWFYEDVEYVYENGLMIGTNTEGTLFSPDESLTRAMLVTILWRMEDCPGVNLVMPYSDVEEDAWYAEAVRWAAAVGIVLGNGDGTFAPEDTLTREQLATILHRYAQYNEIDVSVGENTNILSYEDAFDISGWAIPAVQWACGAGMLEDKDGYINPQTDAVRAETAVFLHRLCEVVD